MERRTVTTHEFQPAGADGELPRTFALHRKDEHQVRRSSRERWQRDASMTPATEITLLGTFTREQLCTLIADGAACLAWNGRN